jgi:putative hemolysin
MSLLLPFRPDLRLVANRFYCRRVPGVASFSIGIDPAHLRSRTPSGLRSLMGHLDRGGAILTFPAGGVATYRRLGAVQDRVWAPGLARLVQRYQTPVVPIYFAGRNRLVYHVARRLHARLGAALLLSELLAKRGARISVQIGAPIPFEDLQAMVHPVALVAYLRQRTYELGGL